MFIKRLSSGTPQYPEPDDLIRALLKKLIERGVETAWAHFEVIHERGWFHSLLSGKQPWIEIGFKNAKTVELNLGLKPNDMTVIENLPSTWIQSGKFCWNVPISDCDRLVDWIKQSFKIAAQPGFRITGWIEGT